MTTTPAHIQGLILAYNDERASDDVKTGILAALCEHARHRLAEETGDTDGTAGGGWRTNIAGTNYRPGPSITVWSAESNTGWMMDTDAIDAHGRRYTPGTEGRVSR